MSIRDHGVKGNKFIKWLDQHHLVQNKPFVVNFGPGQLLYLATVHSAAKNSSTVQLAKKAIKNHKVSCIILEGLDNDLHIDRAFIDDMFPGETKYIADYALKNGIKIVGAEPPTKFIFQELMRQFSKTDLLLWEFLRHFKIFRREKHSQTEFINDWSKNVLPHVNRALKLKDTTSFDHEQAYFKAFGKKFHYDTTDMEITAPDITSRILYRRISAYNDLIRDKFAVHNVISKQKRISLVVFGMNHIYAQFPVLEKKFPHWTIYTTTHTTKARST